MTQEKRGLSKSRFCTGIQCHKALYLGVHNSDLAEPVTASRQMIFDQGTAVGVEARNGFPGGVLIEWDHRHSAEALQATKDALASNPAAIFEAAFVFGPTLVRIDVLRRNGDAWDLIEVKSSTGLNDEYIFDMAIQKYVAEGAGLKIKKVFLKHLNRACHYPNLQNLFEELECTDQVNLAVADVPKQVAEMISLLDSSETPKVDIGAHCYSPYECDFMSHCWAHIPKHSVFELNSVWNSAKFDFYKKGTLLIQDIPEGTKVSRAKPQQLTAVRTGKPVIDLNGLREFLGGIKYPAFFFDFESFNPAIPRYVGTRPYDQIPFQYSCHVQNAEGSELSHIEYLADGSGDPREEVAESLLDALGEAGTILAYNDTFEKTRINELGKFLPHHEARLGKLIPRFVDLRDAFSKYYYHPDFHGSLSIKDVLPVLVPSLSYKGMAIGDGGSAQAAFLKLCDPTISEAVRSKCRDELLQYCKHDTFAMVALLKRLREIAAG